MSEKVAPIVQTVLHVVSAVAVQGCETPREHVDAAEHALQSSSSKEDHVLPSSHFDLHTRSNVGSHFLRMPCLQGVAWHVLQGLLPVSDHVLPLTQRDTHLYVGERERGSEGVRERENGPLFQYA